MKYDIIIPIYNIQQELGKCLDSISRQTYGDFRAIMVDDGSTDQSPVIAKSYAAGDPRFEYYRKENGGLSDARNFGIAKASSEYILFVDGDDFLEEHALRMIEQELSIYPVDVLEFNGWLVENGRKTRHVNDFYIDAGKVKCGRDYILDNVKARRLASPVWLKAVRRSMILEHRHYFVKGLLHEDELWTPRLYLLADTVKYIDHCLYNYVQREGSIMHRADKMENARHAKKILFQLEDYYRSLDLTRRQRNILTSYLARQMISVCRISEKECATPADRKFIRRNARDIKSIGKMILFFAFPGRYQVLSEILKIIIRY
nr:glycosyltransferase [uncultured Schaedlerella sp.]